MSGKTFEQCKENLGKVTDLLGLFELWREAHKAEAKEIREIVDFEKEMEKKKISEGEIFEKRIYKNKIRTKEYFNTISSHFVQFFYREKTSTRCDKCTQFDMQKLEQNQELWEFVLANAFNMDGTVDTFDVEESGGYSFICLLKEANDSSKDCPKDYEVNWQDKANVNRWLKDWREKDGNYKMLNKLNNAFYRYTHDNKELKKGEDFYFTQKMAYMNVNKRGGTSTTAGLDQTAVINYAKRYKDFILKEIDILSKDKEDIKIFVGGKKGKYFEDLMKELCCNEKLLEHNVIAYKSNMVNKGEKRFEFINITHPSGRISVSKLADEMRGKREIK